MLFSMLKAKAESVLAPALIEVCNDTLASNPTHANVQVSAAKWTPKGNLVMFASPRVSWDALFAIPLRVFEGFLRIMFILS